MLTEKVLVVSLTPLVVSAPLKAHPTSPPAQASLPRMELRSGTRKGNAPPRAPQSRAQAQRHEAATHQELMVRARAHESDDATATDPHATTV